MAAVVAACEEKTSVECREMLTQVVGLLLLYLAPAEAYCVVWELIRSSK